MASNKDLRKILKQRRQQLSGTARHAANKQINQRIQSLKTFQRAKYIAAYVGTKGEADPMPSLYLADASGKACYLPVLHPWFNHKMLFAPWSKHSSMRYNRFAIPEPQYQLTQVIKPGFLDMVLVPLVGFDQHCQRLGMGGGFYDHTFAFRKHRQHWQRPLLVGVAFDEQQVDALNTYAWDVAMDVVITPSTIHTIK
jgi:5-formyltetrahydrofolate cyclo-ligase